MAKIQVYNADSRRRINKVVRWFETPDAPPPGERRPSNELHWYPCKKDGGDGSAGSPFTYGVYHKEGGSAFKSTITPKRKRTPGVTYDCLSSGGTGWDTCIGYFGADGFVIIDVVTEWMTSGAGCSE